MAERKYLIKTPAMSEYIFHCMVNTPKEVIRELVPHEMAFFKNKRAMRRFADNESLEKTVALFARIGIPHFIAFGNRRGLMKVFEEIDTQFDVVDKRKDLVREMGTEKIFVVCSNELLLYGQLASQNSHSKIYQLNTDYVKIQQKIADSGKWTMNEDVNNAASSFEMMAAAILQVVLKIDKSQSMVGIPPYQLKVLLALYKFQNTFVSTATICEAINEDRRVRGVVKTCTIMEANGLLVGLAGANKTGMKSRSYTMTEKGLKIVMDFISNIAKKAYYG